MVFLVFCGLVIDTLQTTLPYTTDYVTINGTLTYDFSQNPIMIEFTKIKIQQTRIIPMKIKLKF